MRFLKINLTSVSMAGSEGEASSARMPSRKAFRASSGILLDADSMGTGFSLNRDEKWLYCATKKDLGQAGIGRSRRRRL
jgi:hypothetical protein